MSLNKLTSLANFWQLLGDFGNNLEIKNGIGG